jgi:hypothetical protein
MAVLSYDIIEKIADMVDIDTRRNMGFLPRKLSHERLNHVKQLYERHVSSQRQYYQYIEGEPVFVNSTLLPLSSTRCMYYSYSIIFGKVQICLIVLANFNLSMLEKNEFTWRGVGINNAIYISHPYTTEQDVSLASCYGVSSYLSATNIDVLQQTLKNS